MAEKPSVSIIIVNWNGRHWLQMCLPTLKKASDSKVEWIIVDNASTDGSVSWVRKHYPKAIVIENDRNLGFSHANNVGYLKSRGKYVLFLNNDTKVDKDFIREMVKPFLRDRTVGGVQSKILLLDDPKKLDSVGAYLTMTGFLYHNGFKREDNPEFDNTTDLYTVKGASMMFRRDVLDAVSVDGWIFDPSYFAYFEETDLCHRIWLAGYRLIYAPKAVIYHKMGATSSQLNNYFVQYHSFKNRINAYMKNLGAGYLIRILPIHIASCIIVSLAFLLKGKTVVAGAVWKAIFWNMTSLPETLRKRKYVQTVIRKIPDSRFLPRLIRNVGISYYLNFSRGFL